MSGMPPNPIDDARRVGTVTVAAAQWVTINLPNAGATCPHLHHGESVPRGLIGGQVGIQVHALALPY